MINKEEFNESNFYGQIFEEENVFDPSSPCDPNNPNYPWVPCGINKDKSK